MSIQNQQLLDSMIGESDNVYRTLFEKMTDPILLLKDGRFIDCNAATLKLLAYQAKSDFLNLRPCDISPPLQPDGRSSEEKAEELIASAIRSGFQRFEWVHQRSDGLTVPVEVMLTPVMLKGELILHTVWRDISERIRVEEQLHKSKTKFQTLYDATSDAVMLLNKKGFFDCNKATLAIFGCVDQEEFCTLHPSDLSPVTQPCGINSMEQANRYIAIAMDNGYCQFEWIHKRADTGKIFPADVLLTAMEIDGRRIIQAVVRDISKRKTTEDALRESEEKFHALFQNSPIGIFHSSLERYFLAVNPTFSNMLGYTSPEELIEQITDIRTQVYCDPGQRDEIVATMLAQSEWVFAEGNFRCKDGGIITVSIKGRKIMDLDSKGEIAYLEVFIEDITERKQREQELRDSHFRWKFAIEGSGYGVWDWDIQSNEAIYSKYWKEMLGYAENDILPRNDEWVIRIHPDDRSYVAGSMQAYLEGETELYIVEYRLRCKDDSYKWILGRGIIVSRDEDGNPLRMIGTHSDITERKHMEEQIRQLAFYDPLTKLANRLLLNDRLALAISTSQRSGCHIAVIFLDLDNFKPLNDRHGHVVGDLLLMEAANRLKNCVRNIDTVARFGGDEFVVVLGQLDADKAVSVAQAKIIAEKIRHVLSVPYRLTIPHEGQSNTTVEHRCTASIGVALTNPEVYQDVILGWADAAMYQAKEAGRNLIRFYDTPG